MVKAEAQPLITTLEISTPGRGFQDISREVQGLLQQAGATSIQAYGDYEDRPFAADVSGDLILVAQK